MDKKNTTIGVLLLLAAFTSLYLGNRFAPTRTVQPVASVNTAVAAATVPNGVAPVPAPAPSAATFSSTVPEFTAVAKDAAGATTLTLENEYVAVRFTNFGGAVRDIALKKYPAIKGRPEPYVFNALHADPMLAFVDLPGLDRDTSYQLVSQDATSIVYRAVFDGRVEVTRRYTLTTQSDKQHDPYVLHHETSLRNVTDQAVALPPLALSLGTAAPVDMSDIGDKLAMGYSNGTDQEFYPRSKLEAGNGFFGIGASGAKPFISSQGPVVWSSISNKFFTAILTPEKPGASSITRRVKLLSGLSDENRNAYGLTGATRFDVASLPARADSKLTAEFYVGPKEYRRLANETVFKANQDKVMQFGLFKFFSQILLTLMTWIHGWFPTNTWAWGYAIVLTTLFLKVIFVPFTLAASRSAKRMQKIQPEMQAVREKFKDNPQKLQAATMELFKKHKVNPMGGCLPILITIPFFMGFFSMLQSTAELRFQPFLWASDLSAPDTVGHFLGLPINIMPVLMGATMIFQMRLTPSPTMDNAQAKMMKFMPVIMALFCYTFSCALALYSTINGIFTIVQQMVINRSKDEPVSLPTAPAGKPMKNVTPSNKK